MLTSRWYVVSSLLLCACGALSSAPAKTPLNEEAAGEPSLGPVYKHGEDKLIATVGPDGGKLTLRNDARLEIPPNALAENTQITLAEGGMTTAFSNHEYEEPIGPTLEVAPALSPALPLKISIPLARLPEGFSEEDLAMAVEVIDDDNQRALEMTGVQTRWHYMPAKSSNGKVVGELAQVPGMRIQFLVSRGN